jgi:hypothetical protein
MRAYKIEKHNDQNSWWHNYHPPVGNFCNEDPNVCDKNPRFAVYIWLELTRDFD